MKRLHKFCIAAMGCAFVALSSGCSDSYLDEHMYSKYGPGVSDVEAKLVGLHYKIGQMLGRSWDQGYAGIWQDGTDVGAPGDITGTERPFFKYAELNSEHNMVSGLWDNLYSLIGAANLIINNEEVGSDAQRAEARFFRAYAYNQLVTGWGDVVLLTEPVSTPRTDFARTPKAEVDKVIEEDLMYAIANLPAVNALAKPSRVGKDAARMLAAEAFLRMGYQHNDASYYKKAEEAVSPVITEGNYKLISERFGQFLDEPSGDYYSDMFRYGNQRRSQGNTENIWLFEMENNAIVPGGTIDNPQQRRNWVPGFHKIAGMQNADSIGGRGNGRLRLSNYVKYGLYEKGDIRNSNNNIRRVMYYNRQGWGGATYNINKDGYICQDGDVVAKTVTVGVGSRVYVSVKDTLAVFYPHTTKWGGYDPNDDFGYALVKDFPLMRFGEAYLLRAEARMRQGNNLGAAEDINVLRDRAFKDARVDDPDAGKVTADMMNIDFILDERIRELVGEENRRFTLMRTGELGNRVRMMMQPKWAESTPEKAIEGFDESKHILLPIPLTEIQLNKDGELKQNPGY